MKIRIVAGVAFAIMAAVIAGIVIHNSFGDADIAEQDGIRFFESYGQIEKVLAGIEEEEPTVYAMGDAGSMPDVAVNEAAAEPVPKSSETYVQVEGVDEADIIKNDGKYIYYASRLGYDIVIAEVSGAKAEEVALIPEEETGMTADALYLSGDRLVIIGAESQEDPKPYTGYMEAVTDACIYDVSDPENPAFVARYRQSGFYVSSRLVDGYLYLITTDYMNRDEKRIVPSAGVDDAYEKLEADHVCCFPEPAQRAYAVAGAVSIDGKASKIKTDTRAVLGASEEIYCNNSSLYLTDCRPGFDELRTNIIKANIGKGSVDFAEQGSVRGHVLDQFSMDEKDGYLRIATTAFVREKEVNYLYVLDDKLKTVGKVRGFAAGEEIKAVRYMGDMSYVITYEQTDPLFVIDLSDPENPEMKGSVKITGFSSLLVPEGKDQLIGIGSSTSEGEFGEMEDGVKIALFDISDPMKPTVLDSVTYRDISSDAQYDHKALTVNDDEGWYAIPYIAWESGDGGVLQFKVEDDQLVEMADHKNDNGIDRCVFIGEYLFGLEDADDNIVSWESAH